MVPALRGVHRSPIGCSTIEHTHVHTLQWRSFTPDTRRPTLALTHVSIQDVSTVSLSPDRISDGYISFSCTCLVGSVLIKTSSQDFAVHGHSFRIGAVTAALAGSLIQTLGHRRSLAFVTHFIPPSHP